MSGRLIPPTNNQFQDLQESDSADESTLDRDVNSTLPLTLIYYLVVHYFFLLVVGLPKF